MQHCPVQPYPTLPPLPFLAVGRGMEGGGIEEIIASEDYSIPPFTDGVNHSPTCSCPHLTASRFFRNFIPAVRHNRGRLFQYQSMPHITTQL